MIYLDYNATAPLSLFARQAWIEAQEDGWANPSSIHEPGSRARHRLDQAKAAIARALGCRAHELVMTSGGTEANATAIRSALAQAGPGAEIVCSAIEHSSVLRNAAALGALRLVAVDACGRVSSQALAAAISPRTRLVC
ncbi:MAG: aminotransferase class V-fold PLP-dependent enzyme, partial [Planctomycetes bacterium]|nr:aminotransferase class V-fold PLP-dependent enzyme [Planctomycetota bacterium]